MIKLLHIYLFIYIFYSSPNCTNDLTDNIMTKNENKNK